MGTFLYGKKSKQEEQQHSGRTLAMTIVGEEWNILKKWNGREYLLQWTSSFVHMTGPGAGCYEAHTGCEVNMEKLCVFTYVSVWGRK